jgi:NitT/TauT family transport system permease protein
MSFFPTASAAPRVGAAAGWRSIVFPVLTLAVLLALWSAVCLRQIYPDSVLPAPWTVASGFAEEARAGHLLNDTTISLFRVGVGYACSVVAGVPLGLLLGRRLAARLALLPLINFLRSISPIAWIPFAILWFPIGHGATIFLIFLATFPPIALSTVAAVAGVPSVYFRVARDYDLQGAALLWRVILPAALPPLLTALRVAVGLAWLVMVAAEMIAGDGGLGYLINDARNNARPDLVVVGMITIGGIGIVLDRLLMLFTRIPSLRWGYDR